MLIFFESGRLGNQLFQVTFLNEVRTNNERIILVGFDDFFNTFQKIPGIKNIPYKKNAPSLLIIRCLSNLLYFFSWIGLISFIEQRQEQLIDGTMGRTTGIIRKRGLLKNLTMVREGYFQGETFFTRDTVNVLKFNKDIWHRAQTILQDLPKDKKRVFIHIRKGDYRSLAIFGVPGADLPEKYYLKALKLFDLSTTYFVVCSDENVNLPAEIEKIHYKSANSVSVDLALMTLCDGAILSNSSLSWWGGYLQKSGNLIIAPKFWLGYKSKEYYPKGIYVSRWQWIEAFD